MGDSHPLVTGINTMPARTANQTNQIKVPKEKRKLNIATWNVRRGLISHENEIRDLLLTEEIDLIFLTETDTPYFSHATLIVQ